MKNRVTNKLFSAVASWASKINIAALKEDFRKAGLVLIGAGYIGVIVGGDGLQSRGNHSLDDLRCCLVPRLNPGDGRWKLAMISSLAPLSYGLF